ncbi:DUF1775 domain-containing protein [Methylobacterium platani]|uniref:Copper resistance protein CopZ n=2 Tax=Methylobacterium platani TaxID=427683 RepID=A0A179RXN1_9HYPH|nr:DUF1775 domain-containing protein [Methylobacterium platani]KMO16768.1 copper chaperone [Methylobacterium platani JCM 14648]OAS13854.1 copper resistance protein CopZ [Methylobacterium platani]
MTFPLRAGLAAALSLVAAPALAHAVLGVTQASPNQTYRGVVQIGHGCEGRATTGLTVTIPEGVIDAKPMPKAGWQLSTVKGAYARPIPSHHGTIAEGVKEITWTGGPLPDDQYDEFVFQARLTDAVAPGGTVYFPVRQVCDGAVADWREVPAAGRSARDLASPAPGVRIVAAADGGPAPAAMPAPAAAGPVKAGDLAIAQPWIRATPGGAKVAGGYLQVTNTGTEPDRLVSASIPLAARGEVHQMSMDKGVARMAPVEAGLVIKPGETVVLKPGGYHLMFLDLKGPVKAGDTLDGSLTFERAGTVPVRFQVGAIGASAPEAAGGHQHH